jgi:hypothetical protein
MKKYTLSNSFFCQPHINSKINEVEKCLKNT